MSRALDGFRLDGRIVPITAASTGPGMHFARLLAGVGARVALAARRSDKLLSVTQGCTL